MLAFNRFSKLVAMSVRKCSTINYNYETLKIEQPSNFVKHIEINRPDKRNAMNESFFKEMIDCFQTLSYDPDCRVIVLSGAGKIFTAGIDLQFLMKVGQSTNEEDPSRKAIKLQKIIPPLQESFNVIENCRKPVIAAVHNACIGGGVDMITACDIRYCTEDSSFQVKEVEVGLAADIGTLQRLPKIINGDSLVRELVFTGRKMFSDEAMKCGLVNRCFPTKDEMMKGVFELAKNIADLSPIAVQTSKLSLNYSRDHTVMEGLQHIALLNSTMLQSEDTIKAAMSLMSKEKAVFSKL